MPPTSSNRPCLIRLIREEDYPAMERIYLGHEGVNVPLGYFDEFAQAIRDPDAVYFVAEVDGQVIGGGGLSNLLIGDQACLIFGTMDRDWCRMGYGTLLLVSRLYFVASTFTHCTLTLTATERSSPFFSRLGFAWHDSEKDEQGNIFLHGSHELYARELPAFQQALQAGGATLDPSILARIEEEKKANEVDREFEFPPDFKFE